MSGRDCYNLENLSPQSLNFGFGSSTKVGASGKFERLFIAGSKPKSTQFLKFATLRSALS